MCTLMVSPFKNMLLNIFDLVSGFPCQRSDFHLQYIPFFPQNFPCPVCPYVCSIFRLFGGYTRAIFAFRPRIFCRKAALLRISPLFRQMDCLYKFIDDV